MSIAGAGTEYQYFWETEGLPVRIQFLERTVATMLFRMRKKENTITVDRDQLEYNPVI